MDSAERDVQVKPDVPGGIAAAAVAQQRQVIRWERFLPRRSLRVLLVEHDDSTRHIVAALLRKCSYHVAAVADGLKAWEVLKQKEYKFDLVLTEVEMPSLSGVGLLSKIMGSEQSKNIPVIMMSSNDSVNVVFKCMLKGAVDFLVKPVRRNELRNLWQHVWRKHCSTSYIHGNESVNNNNHTKSDDLSDNNAASNNVIANNGSFSKNREKFNTESDTESSGSKAETDIQSTRREQELIPNSDASSPMAIDRELDEIHADMMLFENESKKENAASTEYKSSMIGKEVIDVTFDLAEKSKKKKKSSHYARSSCREDIMSIREGVHGNLGDHGSSTKVFHSNKSSEKIIDFIGVGNTEYNSAVTEKDAPMEEIHTRSLHMEGATTSDDPSSCELSLRRSHTNGVSKEGFQEKFTLKHSAASAFSRYGTGNRLPCQKDGSTKATRSIMMSEQRIQNQPHCNNHGADKEEHVHLPSTWESVSSSRTELGQAAHHQLDSACNNEENVCAALNSSGEDAWVAHRSNEVNHNVHFPPRQHGLVSHPFPVRAVPLQGLCTSYGAILQPLFYPDTSTLGSAAIDKAEDSRSLHSQRNNHLCDQFQQRNENLYVHMLENGNGDHVVDERIKNTKQFVLPGNRNGACDQNNLNGTGSSGSGEMTDASAPSGIVADFGNTNGFNHCNNDCDRSRREVALMKFRLKRKDRCFEKKVRYHSRKKLAEQRPRIKGQFVRQSAIETNAVATEED